MFGWIAPNSYLKNPRVNKPLIFAGIESPKCLRKITKKKRSFKINDSLEIIKIF